MKRAGKKIVEKEDLWKNPLSERGSNATVGWSRPSDSCLGRTDEFLEFLAQFMAFFGQAQCLVIVCGTKFLVAASMILPELQFHDLPGII